MLAVENLQLFLPRCSFPNDSEMTQEYDFIISDCTLYLLNHALSQRYRVDLLPDVRVSVKL